MEMRGLSGFSNYLEDYNTGKNTIGIKPAKRRERKRKFHSSPLSFTVVTQSLSPQSYIDSSLILLAYAVALSKAVLLFVMSLKRIASGDLARIRGLGNGGGDGVRVKTLVLWDLVEGGRGKDEYLFKLVSTPPLRLGSEGLSSVGDVFMLEDEPFNALGLASSKA